MQDQKGEPPDSQVEDFIQGSPYQDKPVEGNIQGRQDRQDLKGEPPESCVEEFIQGMPSQDSRVEGIIQGRQDREDQRGSHLTAMLRSSPVTE